MKPDVRTVLPHGAAVAAAAVVAFALAGCVPPSDSSSASSAPHAGPPTPVAALPRCPPIRPSPPTPLAHQDTSPVVGITPTGGIVCRYAGLNPPEGQARFGLLWALPLGAERAASLAGRFNSAVGQFPDGPVNCPMDTGDTTDIYLADATTTMLVAIGLTGCPSIASSSRTGSIGGDLVKQLEVLKPTGA